MDVADGDGESIGGIGRFGSGGQRKQAGDHELDLVLGGEAVAGDGGLDGERGVFSNGQSGGCGGEKSDAAHVAQPGCRFVFNSGPVATPDDIRRWYPNPRAVA